MSVCRKIYTSPDCQTCQSTPTPSGPRAMETWGHEDMRERGRERERERERERDGQPYIERE